MTTADTAQKLPHWELDSIYPGLESEPFEQAVGELAARLDGLDQFLIDHRVAHVSSTTDIAATTIIERYLEQMNAVMRVNSTLRLYVWCIVDTDSSNVLVLRK